ncbi:MAG: precorrin-4 C(11)-methyltransferase [Candidatus Adiutrix sp.]|jgi:precorrin-4/cobalt-precorrin-4 C11-methyltransferase|nr:precorrin-4 C(11)-methyltransferase [Candidatus Adiutrix sp.]
MENPVIFVGAGPGDPELITVAGQKALAAADLVVHAGSLVNPQILSWCQSTARLVDSAELSLEEITGEMVAGWKSGQKVVRLHTGDPSIYGAIHEQLVVLKASEVPWKIIPGITAALAGAAVLGLEYTLPEITQTFIITRAAGRTPVPEGEDLALLAKSRSSMAIYLSATQGETVGRVLGEAYGPKATVAMIYRATWPDQQVIWTNCENLAESLAAEGLDRHTLILVGPALDAIYTGRETPKSKLYDAAFTHMYRAGKDEAADQPAGKKPDEA